MRNIPAQFARIRPGNIRTLPLGAGQTMQPGEVYKFTFAVTASLFQQIRNPGGVPQYVSLKTTADVHVAFGANNADVVDPTIGNALMQPGDSWQDWALLPTDTGFKVKGDTGAGDIYLVLSSQ